MSDAGFLLGAAALVAAGLLYAAVAKEVEGGL